MVDELLLAATGIAFGIVGVAAAIFLDADGRVTRFAQNADLARVLLMGTLFCALVGFLAGLCAYGFVTGMRAADATASQQIVLAGAFLLFAGILLPTLRGGARGLRARF